MKVILLTSDYHVSANIGIKTFLKNRKLKKNSIEVSGILVADQFNLGARSLKRTAHYFRKIQFGFFVKQIMTSIWKKIKMFIGKHFFKNRKRNYYSLEEIAGENNIPLLSVDSINSAEVETFIKKEGPDLLISFFLLERVKKKILSLPKKGSINVHPALMQQHRGVFTGFWALLKNWKKSGATVHYMTEKIDEGEIILQKRFFVHPADSMHAVNKKAAKLSGKLVAKALINIKKKRVKKLHIKKLGPMFTVPNPADIKQFYAKGRRLITLKEFFTL